MNVPWHIPDPIPANLFAQIRRRTIFDCCKWDPQVGDTDVLSPQPLLIGEQVRTELFRRAEQLAAEIEATERELLDRPDLHRRLSIPRSIRRILRHKSVPPAGIARVIRFDFHFTEEGWRISEANVDVPGGFNESAGFARLVAAHYPDAAPCGDPSAAIARSISAGVAAGGHVALVHATAYTDDRQVMIYLSKDLETAGLKPWLIGPHQLSWEDGRARLATEWSREPVSAIIRFFPAEWLANLPRRCGWRNYFAGARTPACNPASALLVQTKRLPLVWNDLQTPMPAWRELLPETRDPRDAPWSRDNGWIVKPALGRVGEGIGMPDAIQNREWKNIRRSARWFPQHWIAQRRFKAVPLMLNGRAHFPCFGVYTVAGRACGIYGRLGRIPLINATAQDVAVLVAKEQTNATRAA